MLFVSIFFFIVHYFGAISCLRLISFLDFLGHNHLNHGIIVMCDDVIVTRNELKVITAGHYWISYFNIDRTSPDRGIAAFEDLFYHGAPKVGVSLDIKCQSKSILEFASNSNFFNASQAWFILAESLEAGLNALETVKINIDADVTLGVKVSNEDKLRLYDLYKVCHQCDSMLQTVDKGNWSACGGMEIRSYFGQTMVQRRRNFNGILLSGGIAINSAPKDVQLTDYIEGFSNKHLDAMQRKTYHMLKILKDMFNFQLKVVISDSWGVQQDGNWTGVMGNLVGGVVDISLSPLRYTQERVLAVRYLPEVHVEIIRFLFRHPRRSPIRNIFLQPFTSTVWYTVLAFIAAGVLLMAITMHHENERYGTGSSENKLDFFTLIILEAIFLQGPSEMFQCASTRTLIISICIFAVMLFQFYSAFIVGSLLADVPRTIVNMPALFNSTLDIGMEDIAYNYEFFINTSNQMAKDIYVHRVMRNPRSNILPLQKGLERLGRGGYAYHVAVVRAYGILKERLTESEFCDLQEVAMDPPFPSCSAVTRGSPYKEYFATAILQLRETGIMNYHNNLWAVEKPHCSQEMMEKDTTVDMEHFIPALGFLVVAMLMSGVVFGAEVLVFSLNKFNFKEGPPKKPRLHQH